MPVSAFAVTAVPWPPLNVLLSVQHVTPRTVNIDAA